MKPLFLLCLVSFLAIHTSAQIDFEAHVIIDNTFSANAPRSVYATDIDGDGDMDMLSASQNDDKIAWYENTDGSGNFSLPKTITTNADAANSVYATDMDGDGDMDVLSASWEDSKIAWYENTDGLGNFGPQQIITTNADYAQSVYATDIDGDGDMDVLSAFYSYYYYSYYYYGIAWYENTDGMGSFGPQQVITTNLDGATSVYTTDIDGDGDMDVLSASNYDDKIAWYENIDGAGSFGTQQIITIDAQGASSVYATDIDNDGDMDVLSASDSKIVWYENTDGLGSFGIQQIITTSVDVASSVYATDMDGDGDMDVLSASTYDNKIAWYENTDGMGSFGTQQIITINTAMAQSVYAADIDGDGDMDVLSASWEDDKIAWYENTDGLGNFGPQQILTIGAEGAYSVYATDIDGDGDMDVLFTSSFDDKIAWYENTDGMGNFGAQQIITAYVYDNNSVYVTDIDSDGDVDVLFTSDADDKIAWYENTDGLGNFGAQQIITTNFIQPRSVYATDIDGDGDMDILCASNFDDKIAWYENTDGLGNFGPQQIITINVNVNSAISVSATDLDGDGDMDVLLTSFFNDKIAWYENTDGLGNFGPQQIITTNTDGARSVYATDIDGDGDMDVLSASWEDDKIAWYENTDGLGNFGPQQIITTSANQVGSIYATDIDGDGDMDVLSASSDDDKIAWYENTDGMGSFGMQQIITTNADGAWSVYASDIDGDGDMDVLSASWEDDKIAWYENKSNTTSISNTYLNKYFNISPIPTSDFILIDSDVNIAQIEIYNRLGQLLLSNTNQTSIDLSSLLPGIYFCKVKDSDGNFGIRKVVKE